MKKVFGKSMASPEIEDRQEDDYDYSQDAPRAPKTAPIAASKPVEQKKAQAEAKPKKSVGYQRNDAPDYPPDEVFQEQNLLTSKPGVRPSPVSVSKEKPEIVEETKHSKPGVRPTTLTFSQEKREKKEQEERDRIAQEEKLKREVEEQKAAALAQETELHNQEVQILKKSELRPESEHQGRKLLDFLPYSLLPVVFENALKDEKFKDKGQRKEYLESLKPHFPTKPDEYGSTPLHYVQTKEVAEAYIELGSPIDKKDLNGCTPLRYAIKDDMQEVASLLLKAGAKMERAEKQISLLAYAKSPEMVRELLSGGCDPDKVDQKGNNALHHLGTISKNSELGAEKTTQMIDTLIKSGVDVNLKNKEGVSARQALESSGYGNEIKEFFQKRYHEGEHAKNFIPKFDFLTDAKLSAAEPKKKEFNINEQDENGNTLLHVLKGKTQDLLDLGADPNIKNKRGETPLRYWSTRPEETPERFTILAQYAEREGWDKKQLVHDATRFNSLLSDCKNASAIKGLVKEFGVNVDERDNLSNTPLQKFLHNNESNPDSEKCSKMVKAFIEVGAEPRARNRNLETITGLMEKSIHAESYKPILQEMDKNTQEKREQMNKTIAEHRNPQPEEKKSFVKRLMQ